MVRVHLSTQLAMRKNAFGSEMEMCNVRYAYTDYTYKEETGRWASDSPSQIV
jgi:hypothetical protein